MKAHLLFADADLDLEQELPPQAPDLIQDLALDTLFDAMALGDPFLRDVAERAVLLSLTEPERIVFRQHVLEDCIKQPAVIKELYDLAFEAIEGERKIWRGFARSPEFLLHRSIKVMELYVDVLDRLREIAAQHRREFESPGFTALFDMLIRELDDRYLQSVEAHLTELQFRHGLLVSARLGRGNRGVDYVLRRPNETRSSWRQWLPFGEDQDFTLIIAERDESGQRALSELRDRGVSLAAHALAQSVDHILGFFRMLRAEVGFYLGCLNLRRQLIDQGEAVCLPTPMPADRISLEARGLYDVGLTLRVAGRVVANDVNAAHKQLVLITGANQGGKSTFLRGVGLAQLMMQCGMFVGAEEFHANVCTVIFTHYRREEDPTMTSGKWDEELSRMSAIVDRLAPHSLVLFNESFASTNEQEGAAIASGIVQALLDSNVEVLFVTHSYELAHWFHQHGGDGVLSLRAGRESGGRRTFKLEEAEPLPTSYGQDLYQRIFGRDVPDQQPPAPRTPHADELRVADEEVDR